jgi:DNA-binding response OmpR family regulator
MQVIVIDDDATVGSAIKLWLESGGADVFYAEGARAGIAALKVIDFDLAIVDIFMPVVGGIETIKILRQIKPKLPVIAMSGHMDRDNQTSALGFARMTAGSIYSLAKPFRPRDLKNAVEACIGRGSPSVSNLEPGTN